jgi:hypothetical protein
VVLHTRLSDRWMTDFLAHPLGTVVEIATSLNTGEFA